MAAGGDWARLATYVIRRRDQLAMTQADVAAAGGPSVATLRVIEDGRPGNYRSGMLAKLERALGWAEGSVAAILDGREPALTSDRAGAGGADPRLVAIRDDPTMPDHLRRQAAAQIEAIQALLDAARATNRGRNAG